MKEVEQDLLKSIAEEHNVSVRTLQNIIKSSNIFSYEKTTVGKRTDEYYGLIKFAVNNLSK